DNRTDYVVAPIVASVDAPPPTLKILAIAREKGPYAPMLTNPKTSLQNLRGVIPISGTPGIVQAMYEHSPIPLDADPIIVEVGTAPAWALEGTLGYVAAAIGIVLFVVTFFDGFKVWRTGEGFMRVQ